MVSCAAKSLWEGTMKLPRFLHLVAGTGALSAIPVLLAGTVATQAQTSPEMRVTLLGTGTPGPIADRFGPSTLIEAGSEKLVFDCGRGCPIRLQQKGRAPPRGEAFCYASAF